MKLKDIAGILTVLGFATVISSFLDFYTYLCPVVIKNPEWVFEVSQRIADTTILPVLGIVLFLLGFYFSDFRKNKNLTAVTKVLCGSLCVIFFVFLSFNTIMYGISMKAVKLSKIESLKFANNSAKERINAVYEQNQKEISVAEYNSALNKLGDELSSQINYLNLTHTKINIKTLMTLFIFSFVYLITAIKIFSLDKLLNRRRNFIK